MYVFSHTDTVKLYKKDKKNPATGKYLGNQIRNIYKKKGTSDIFIKHNNRYKKVQYNRTVGLFVVL